MQFIAWGLVAAGLSVCKFAYTRSTYFEKDVIVDEKFTRTVGDKDSTKTVMLVSDKDNNNYHVGMSLWYGKFHHTETWTSIKPDRLYRIRGYGWRIAPLDIYPNIIDVKEIITE